MFQLPIRQFGCDKLEMQFRIPATQEQVRKMFGKEFSPKPDFSYIAYQEFSERKSQNYCSILAHHGKKRSREKFDIHLHIAFACGISEAFSPIQRMLPRAFDFLTDNIVSLERRSSYVNAVFTYDAKKYAPLPAFPILPPPMPFESGTGVEVRGIRLAVKGSSAKKRPEFSIIVEYTPEEGVYHNLAFEYRLPASPSLLVRTLQLAAAISREFVVSKAI